MGRPTGDRSWQRLERRRRISRVWQNGSNCWTEMGIRWNMKRDLVQKMFEVGKQRQNLTKPARLERLEDVAKLLQVWRTLDAATILKQTCLPCEGVAAEMLRHA